jgi:hypothetical protein
LLLLQSYCSQQRGAAIQLERPNERRTKPPAGRAPRTRPRNRHATAPGTTHEQKDSINLPMTHKEVNLQQSKN